MLPHWHGVIPAAALSNQPAPSPSPVSPRGCCPLRAAPAALSSGSGVPRARRTAPANSPIRSFPQHAHLFLACRKVSAQFLLALHFFFFPFPRHVCESLPFPSTKELREERGTAACASCKGKWVGQLSKQIVKYCSELLIFFSPDCNKRKDLMWP